MARRLRLFKEQMMKAGVSPSTTSAREDNVDLESLEVMTFSETFVTRSSAQEHSIK